MHQRTCVVAAAALVAASALAGCTATEGTGTFSMFVKDKPTDEFEQIWIRFSAVELVGDDGRTEVWNGSKEVDLRALNESTAKAMLGEAEVPAGNYSQVRLVIDAAWGIDENGTKQDFKVPSGVLRINHALEVDEGGNTTMTADFDLDRSVVGAGASGQYILKPVLHAVLVKEPGEQEEVDEDPDTA